MEKISISSLKPGSQYDQPLFTPAGQKLIGSNVTLTERHISSMRNTGELELLLADSVEEIAKGGDRTASGGLREVDPRKLRVGEVAADGILSRSGQVLVEPGQPVEQHHLEAIEAAGGAFTSKEQGRQRERIVLAEQLVEQLTAELPTMRRRVPAVREPWLRPVDPNRWPDAAGLERVRGEGVEAIRRSYAEIMAGVTVPIDRFRPLLDKLMRDLEGHPTRFTQLALLCPAKEDYLPDHAYTVTILAMATAARLGWGPQDVRGVGQCGLLMDVGMMLVPERIRVGASELTARDRQRVRRHPEFSLALLDHVSRVPREVQVAALQHHERENASGYPYGYRGERLHDYARLLAVIDTFAAITEPRSYRQPKLPYKAMEQILREAGSHAYWGAAVRSLVRAAGLFPVGSCVKLCSGATARVLSANPEQLDRPVVQPLDSHTNQPAGLPVDLATVAKDQLSVVRPIAAP